MTQSDELFAHSPVDFCFTATTVVPPQLASPCKEDCGVAAAPQRRISHGGDCLGVARSALSRVGKVQTLLVSGSFGGRCK
jgi:hypothetical protein